MMENGIMGRKARWAKEPNDLEEWNIESVEEWIDRNAGGELGLNNESE
jgi:hypothetical protein